MNSLNIDVKNILSKNKFIKPKIYLIDGLNFENLQISCKNDIWPVIERKREILQKIMKIGTKSDKSIIMTDCFY